MRGFAAIGLHAPSKDCNVGGALRAAFCFGAALVVIGGGRRYRASSADTTKTPRHVPLIVAQRVLDACPHDAVPVAVEIVEGALDLCKYVHPHSAFYVFGPEGGAVPADVIARCRDVIRISTRACLNLAAAVNVVLYDRASKEAQRGP